MLSPGTLVFTEVPGLGWSLSFTVAVGVWTRHPAAPICAVSTASQPLALSCSLIFSNPGPDSPIISLFCLSCPDVVSFTYRQEFWLIINRVVTLIIIFYNGKLIIIEQTPSVHMY